MSNLKKFTRNDTIKNYELIDETLAVLPFKIDDKNYLSVEHLPEQLGRGLAKTINFRNGFRIINFDLILNENTQINYHNRLPPNTGVGALSLFGNSITDLSSIKTKLDHKSNNSYWGYVPGEKCASILPAGKRCNMLYFYINQKRFNTFPDTAEDMEANPLWNILSGKARGLCDGRSMSVANIQLLNSILNQPLKSSLDWFFLELRVMEILGNSINDYGRESSDFSNLRIPPMDIEKIQNARDILINRIDDPPSIIELSELSGINEFKLKKGFKQIFGTTIYGYLREYRLEKSFSLIESGEMNVTEAAITVGYSNISAFSTAFRKKYGVNPVKCRKKYYTWNQ